jgi:putative ABC transport system permease protein
MTLLHRLASIVRWILRRKDVERELRNELELFIDLSAADKSRDGVATSEARRLAKLHLGGIEQAKERVRTYRHGARLDEFGADIRYAFRIFAKNPGFTCVVVLTLALGIGANTAIFSLIDGLMLRWLPVPKPQELIQLQFRVPGSPSPTAAETFSYSMARALAEQKEVFATLAGFSAAGFNVGPPGSLTKVPGSWVTGEYYAMLGLKPAIGRLLLREDDEPGARLVAVISHGYWERQFGRDPRAVNETVLVNGIPVNIVGVSPAGFVGANVGQIADITIPVAALPRINPKAAPLLGPGNFWLRILARPSPHLSLSAAQTRLNAVWPGIAEQVISPAWSPARRKDMAGATFLFAAGGRGWTLLRQTYRAPLFILMAAVGLVLLIACANVASLLLARASSRQRETAVRLAMGAGRARIVRQLLTESVLLSLMGAAFGIALAWLSSRFLIDTISTGPVQVFLDLTPNWRVLSFAAGIGIATGILFGIAPALRITSAGPSAVLKEGGRMSESRSRLLPTLVSVQIALSLVLLIGASLFFRTLQNIQNFDPGFSREGVLLMNFETGTAFRADWLEEIRRLPGVMSASISTNSPLSGATWTEPAVPAGQPLPERDNAIFIGAGPRFFETIQTRLLSGRVFTELDTPSSPTVGVVSEAFARRHFPDRDPIGQHVSTIARVGTAARGSRDVEIVGIVKNTYETGLRKDPYPVVYVPYAQLAGEFPVTLAVRATCSSRSSQARRWKCGRSRRRWKPRWYKSA